MLILLTRRGGCQLFELPIQHSRDLVYLLVAEPLEDGQNPVIVDTDSALPVFVDVDPDRGVQLNLRDVL